MLQQHHADVDLCCAVRDTKGQTPGQHSAMPRKPTEKPPKGRGTALSVPSNALSEHCSYNPYRCPLIQALHITSSVQKESKVGDACFDSWQYVERVLSKGL